MKTFQVTHTEKTSASKEAIWKLWSDINNWPQWDAGLISCKASGEFQPGNSFELTPHGAPEAVTAVLDDVVVNTRFSDKTDLGFATIQAIHEMNDEANEVSVTHTIIVNVQEEQAGFFEQKMWPGFQAGLPQSVKSLVTLAEKND